MNQGHASNCSLGRRLSSWVQLRDMRCDLFLLFISVEVIENCWIPVSDNSLERRTDKQRVNHRAKQSVRHLILHNIPHFGACRKRLERMTMPLRPVRPRQLDIDKPRTRIKLSDHGLPADGNPIKSHLVLNQGAGLEQMNDHFSIRTLAAMPSNMPLKTKWWKGSTEYQ